MRPLVSAADVNEANYPRIWFDDGIVRKIDHTAEQRAPDHRSIWYHRVGVAAELGATTYFGSDVNWRTYPDYIGDDGHDFRLGDDRVEVKATTRREDIELRVAEEKVDDADYFLLAKCWDPTGHVRLVGYISRPRLKYFGHRFDGDIRINPKDMYPLRPLELSPDDVREVYHSTAPE